MFFRGSVKIEQPGSQPTPVSSELVPGAQNELIGRLQYPTFLPSDFTVSFTMYFWSDSESIRSTKIYGLRKLKVYTRPYTLPPYPNFVYYEVILNLGNDEF